MNEIIKEMLTRNNGYISSAEATKNGVSNKQLQRFATYGELERVCHGLYMSPNNITDEYYVTQFRCPNSVFSHDTALYFHMLSDRTPITLTMTIPTGAYTRLLNEKESFAFFYCKAELFALGVQTIVTPFGNHIRVYDKERTICDCIKRKNKLDEDIVLSAVKQYARSKNADFAKLYSYSEKFHVKNTVKQYMEVLL